MKKIILFSCLSIFGCASAPQWSWHKSGASQSDFHAVKFTCMQRAQQPYSSSTLYNSGGVVSSQSMTTGSSSSGITTSVDLFDACMYAAGWVKRSQQSSNDQALKMPRDSAEKTCVNLGHKVGTYPFAECVKSRVGG
jgi:hypothetical protein